MILITLCVFCSVKMAIEVRFPPKLARIIKNHARFKVLHGGRGSGKTESVANIFLHKAMSGRKVACCREFQSSLEDSVYDTMATAISNYNYPGWTIKHNTLEHASGGKVIFKGLARAPQSIKGLNTFDDCWVEEAQTISAESLKELTPTFRREGCEIWFTANPQSCEDPFSQRFIESKCDGDGLHIVVEINYTDNPWFPATLESERQYDYENLDRALYDHIWLGKYNDSVENNIIKAEWFDACVDAHEKLSFQESAFVVAVHDPSDSGDARAYMETRGNIITDVEENTKLDVNAACEWTLEKAFKAKADSYIWDASGIGLPLKGMIGDYFSGTHVQTYAFKGGDAVEEAKRVIDNRMGKQITNGSAYFNLRSQCYARLAQKCYETYKGVKDPKLVDTSKLISFSSEITHLDKFKSELCRIPRVFNGKGSFQVMRKDEMFRRLKIKSPNLADCAMMRQITMRNNVFGAATNRPQYASSGYDMLG